MRTGLRRAIATAALTSAVGALLVTSPAGAAVSTPPWEPDTGNAVATLTFYDASGNVVTSGNSADSPFATYAVAGSTVRAGDTSAALYYANPDSTTTTPFWYRLLAAAKFTAYPTSTAPADINALSQTHPVATAAGGDLSLDDFESIVTKSATPGYANVVQIRLRTADANNQQSAQYADADLLIDPVAHTWTQVYPAAAVAPGAPTAVNATAGNTAATVSWTAPASDGGGSITGYDVRYSADGGAFVPASSAFHTSTATSQLITGLTNGVSYVFQVAAINSAGTGAYSASSAAAVPVADTSMLSVAAPTTVRYGASAVVSGTLVDATTRAVVAGAPVVLYRRVAPASAYSAYRTLTTTSAGAVSLAVPMTGLTQFYLRYGGSATRKAVNSLVKPVTVSQVVSAAKTASTVRHGSTVRFYGTVGPVGTGQRVYLQRYYSRAWHALSTTAVIKGQRLPNGRVATGYVLPITLTSVATYTFRVYKPATSTVLAGYSVTLVVKST